MSTPYELDAFQQRVVDAPERAIRMVAPAGSGKTETLARRVVARIHAGVDPHRILLLTFDTNARDAITARLVALGAPAGVRVSTLNAFGYGLLRTIFTDERSRLASGVFFPQTQAISDLVKEYGHAVLTEMLGKIKSEAFDTRTIERQELARWCRQNRQHLLRNLEDDPILAKLGDRQFGGDVAREMAAYEQWLASTDSIDFDDQKLRPYHRLLQDAEALDRVQAQFDDVIVDEFQDINRLDALLVDQIAGKSTLLITGDDDQAIYGFRGATAEHLIHPKRFFGREFATYELSINYRCPPKILDVATRLIEHNDDRVPKHPRAHKTIPGTVEVRGYKSVSEECADVAVRMGKLLRQGNGSAAVLARRRSQFGPIQTAMIEAETPYRIEPREDLRIVWSLARRALLLTPLVLDDMPDQETRVEIVRIFAQSRFMPAPRADRLARLTMLDDRSFPGPELQQALHERERTDLAAGIRSLMGECNAPDRLEKLDPLLNTELRTYMDGGNDAKRSASRETSRLASLVGIARTTRFGVTAFAAHIDSLLQPQRDQYGDQYPAVELATCHGAKGREWGSVCLPHCNQGVFPDSRSQEHPYLEAERKLFYVSMTRASEHLLLTWSERTAEGREADPSDFLLEAALAKPRARATTGRRAEPAQTYAPNLMGQATLGSSRPLTPDGNWAPPAPARQSTTKESRVLSLQTQGVTEEFDVLAARGATAMISRIDQLRRTQTVPYEQMRIRYRADDPTATFPLQMGLAFRGIPFAIDDVDRFLERPEYRDMIAGWVDGSSPQLSDSGYEVRDAIAHQLAEHTGSHDPARWRAAIVKLGSSETDVGDDPAGVRIVPH